MDDSKDSAHVKAAKARERAGQPPPGSSENVAAPSLGCLFGLAIIGFFVWIFFFREPDPDWTAKVAAETARQEELDRTRLNNARIACDSGLQSACVEYAEMID